MTDRYETKLRSEIAQAEARGREFLVRAEGMKDALALYLQHMPGRLGKLAEPSEDSMIGFILQKIREAGHLGLTIAEMMDEAEKADVAIKRSTLRSQLWHRKTKGVLVHKNKRYRLASSRPGEGSGEQSEAPDKGNSSGASLESGILPLND